MATLRWPGFVLHSQLDETVHEMRPACASLSGHCLRDRSNLAERARGTLDPIRSSPTT